ncbi:MAG: flagellar hook-basal body complex protein [Rhodospirillales bacterium]|jgi:flagellar hook protein FlgE|nr:flagellar hook-basal body complex protein [Rhodospirillales bacterium]
MSLFGAMTAGVSGLAAQSSAMAAISDNITNVSTIGYKGTRVDFQTLVTKQSAGTLYAAGGVQSSPLGGVDVQGLLQASTTSTHLAISGSGFFLVNEASVPGNGDQFAMTRAGSFYPDAAGYLRNSAGHYLQAWPTDATGNVVLPRTSQAALPNENIISTDFLETVNLNRVSGTSSATTQVSLGANLPAFDEVGASHNLDVQFFDVMGSTNAVTFKFTKSAANVWDLSLEPPSGVAAINLYDDGGAIFRSTGQLEFTTQPAHDAFVVINGQSYVFDNGTGTSVPGTAVAIGTTVGQTVANLIAAVETADASFSGAAGHHMATAKSGNSTTALFTGGNSVVRPGIADFAIDVSGLLNASGNAATKQGQMPTSLYSVAAGTVTDPAVAFNGQGLPGAFGVAEMGVIGFSSGAADMDNTDVDFDGDVDVKRIKIDLGTANETGGITQFGTSFSPNFIDQDGARFGLFSGISVDSTGLVSALYDNGEQRPIYRLPLVTFVNPNGLQAQSGNAWTATQVSGDATLRRADSGPAGGIVQSALEASTVDIGEEFTRMIVVQRAYSAATQIISTADEMMEELVRIKR